MTEENVNIKIGVDTKEAQQNLGSARKEMRQLTDQVKDLAAEIQKSGDPTGELTKKLNGLQNELGQLKDTTDDAMSRVKYMADDFAQVKTALEGIGAGIAVFQGMTAAAELFGIKNEKALEVIKKLQLAQAALNSVNTIAQALNKDSYLMIGLKIIKEQLLTKVTQANTKAQIANNAAVAATPWGAILAVISIVIATITTLTSLTKDNTEANLENADSVDKIREAEEKYEKSKKKLDLTTKQQIATINTYLDVIKSTSNSEGERDAALKLLNDLMGTNISNIKTANNAAQEYIVILENQAQVLEDNKLKLAKFNEESETRIDTEKLAKEQAEAVASAQVIYNKALDDFNSKYGKQAATTTRGLTTNTESLEKVLERVNKIGFKFNVPETTKTNISEIQKELFSFFNTMSEAKKGGRQLRDAFDIKDTDTVQKFVSGLSLASDDIKTVEDNILNLIQLYGTYENRLTKVLSNTSKEFDDAAFDTLYYHTSLNTLFDRFPEYVQAFKNLSKSPKNLLTSTQTMGIVIDNIVKETMSNVNEQYDELESKAKDSYNDTVKRYEDEYNKFNGTEKEKLELKTIIGLRLKQAEQDYNDTVIKLGEERTKSLSDAELNLMQAISQMLQKSVKDEVEKLIELRTAYEEVQEEVKQESQNVLERELDSIEKTAKRQKDIINDWYEEKKNIAKLTITDQEELNAELIRLENEKNAKIAEIDKKAEKDKNAAKRDFALSTALQIGEGLLSISSSLQDAELEAAGDNEKKKLEIKKRYAIADLIMGAVMSAAELAMSIPKTLNAYAGIPFVGPIIAAVQIAAATASIIAQIAKINSMQNEINSISANAEGYAEQGDFVIGASHRQGGVKYELEGGEAVLNKKAMAIPEYRSLASAMNVSTGGKAFPGTSPVSFGVTKEEIQEMFREFAAIPVVVTEKSITRAQKRVVRIKNKAKI